MYPNKNDIFTYVHDADSKVRSRIDKIIVQNCFTVKSYEQKIIYQSDHEMIMTHVELDETIEKGHGIWKNNCSIFQNEVFLEEFEYLWFNWKDQYEFQGPIKSWISCKKEVKLFLIDIGNIFAKQKKESKRKRESRFEKSTRSNITPK